ncbi:hypothetical protein D1007_39521 [Hordeum vulgare]|nr:hypothetical protein D1007_39521 [Hordeum vulgare]
MGACGHPTGPVAPLFCYMNGFVQEKTREELFRGFAAATRWNLSITNLELRQDDPAGETSLPEGESRHRHHQHSSHRRGLVTINIFINTISSPNPSSSLVTNLRLATPIGTCKVASSVDYSL